MVDAQGDLVIRTAGGEVRSRKPVVYQEVAGVRQEIVCRYRLWGQRQVGFQLGAYNHARPLVIDPVVIFSTHFGGGGNEASYAIAVDSTGNPYLTGVTTSADFPLDNSAYQQEFRKGNSRCADEGGFGDAFVTRLNADGSGIVYSTYLGGSGDDLSFGIAVDSDSKAYVTGLTTSLNFPREKAQQPGFKGSKKAGCLEGDAFVTKLNGTGSDLEYSTYLGGTGYDAGSSIAVDGDGNAYVTGNTSSEDFPLMHIHLRCT
ncbi:MAG: SBBP repeat-containing protein [Blastocatellia bacterium]